MARFPAHSPANLASSTALSRSRTTARTVAYWATTALVAAEAVFNYTGAAASLLAAGEADPGTLVVLIALTGLTAASWALRPPARRDLASPARGRAVSMVEAGRP